MQDDILSLVTGGKASFAPTPAPAKPADYSGLITSAEQKYSLPPGLLGAIITKGEHSGVDAVSRKGAVGLGQLMPGTAKDMGVTDPTDPAQNIDGSGKYLGQMLARYNGDHRLAVAAYNAGPGAVDQHGGIPPYPETQAYVTRVLGNVDGAQKQAEPEAAGDFLSLVTGGKQSFSAPAAQAAPQQPKADAPQSSANFVNMANEAQINAPISAETFQPNPDQAKTLRQLDAAGQIDRSPAAMGTAKQPYVMQSADNDASSLGPGVYYVDWKGRLQQTPGKPITAGEGLGHGLVKGIEDVGASLATAKNAIDQFSPILDPAAFVASKFGAQQDTSLQDANAIQNKLFDARYGHNGYGLTGRIGGNVAASAPVMAAGGGALDAAAEGVPALGFIAGQAGRGLGGAVPNLLLRTGSLATRGALEGAGAAGLTSSASDAPIGQQIAEGATIGGLLHVGAPALKAVGTGIADTVGGLTKPLTVSGRNSLIMEHLANLAKGGETGIVSQSDIPGVTRSLAQSIPGGNAGIGALERSMQGTDKEFANGLSTMAKGNTEARRNFLDTFIAPADAVEAAKTSAQASSDSRVGKLMAQASPTKAPAIVQTIDNAMAGPAASAPGVSNTLQAVRKALVSEESGLTQPQRVDFDRKIMAAMGSDAPAPSQDALQANKDRLGAIFDTIGSKTNIEAGDDFKSSLGQVLHEAGQVLPDGEVAPLQKQVQNIVDTIGEDGHISGKSYQALTRKGSPLDRAMAGGGNVGFYAGQIRDALDDALQASAEPADVRALQAARTQYRNMKIAEGAINKAAPGAGVDPGALLANVKKATSDFAYKGGGDLGDAADAAVKQAQARAVYDTRPETLHEAYNLVSAAAAKPGAHPALNDLRTALLDQMEGSAPGYTAHLAQSAAEQQQVAQQQYLRSLGLTTNDGTPTLNKLNGALKKIEADPNAPVTSDSVNKLITLRDDLAMEQGSNAGMGKGSNSHQNFATSALTNAVGKAKGIGNILALIGGGGELAASHDPFTAGVAGLAVKGAADMVGNTYSQKNLLLQQELRNALLNPDTVTLDVKVPKGSFGGEHPVVNSLLKSNAVTGLVDANAVKNRLLGAR